VSSSQAAPSDLWSGFLGAVIGAVVGALAAGGVTFLVVRWQTTRLLRDERDRAQEAREEERRLAREARAEERDEWLRRREEQALASLLPALAELQVAVPQLYALPRPRPSLSPANAEDRAQAQYAYETLLHGLRVDLPLLQGEEIRNRYRTLVGLVEELGRLGLGETSACCCATA
jgi:hypothetical protein